MNKVCRCHDYQVCDSWYAVKHCKLSSCVQADGVLPVYDEESGDCIHWYD